MGLALIVIIRERTPEHVRGLRVSAAGDFNGAGVTPQNPPFFNSGAAYILFGRASWSAGSVEVETLMAADGFRIYGTFKGQNVGKAVKGAGDVNNDGFDDVLIASDSETYLLYGKAGAFAFPFQLSAFTPADGLRIRAESGAFNAVSDTGDINGDGVADFMLGVPGVGTVNGSVGAAYVLYGGSTRTTDYSHSDLVKIAKTAALRPFPGRRHVPAPVASGRRRLQQGLFALSMRALGSPPRGWEGRIDNRQRASTLAAGLQIA